MTLKAIGAGFGRTGTSSMKEALEQLGLGPCCHASEVLFDPEKVRKWCDILDGRSADWEGVFEGYQSSVDWPSSAFYKEQMQAFPEAKVILTVRDPEAWYRSVAQTIYPISDLMAPRWLCFFSSRARRMRRLVFEVIWDGQLRGQFENKDATIAIFEEHIETVKRTVPAERLLVFDVREGWAPLCDFLGISEIPEEPFPHINESAKLKQVVQRLRRRWRLLKWVLAAVGVGLIWGLFSVFVDLH